MDNLSGPKPNVKPTPCLLGLPVEIRQAIISEVVTSSRPAPSLSGLTTENRHRLRNHFYINFRTDPHIYVQRGRYNVLNAEALLTTCRRLREDTNEVVRFYKAQVEKGRAKPVFKLDVMVVKEVGLFPTWLSFPYLPKQIDLLEIKFRIFRPSNEVPIEWVVEGQNNRLFASHQTNWNFEVLFTMYALNRLSPSPQLPEEAVNRWPVSAATGIDFVNGYTSAAALYTVDRMVITTLPREYWHDGRTISPPVKYNWPSRGQPRGMVPGQNLFDFANIPDRIIGAKPVHMLMSAGQLASSNLNSRLGRVLPGLLTNVRNKFCHIMGRSVRVVELKRWDCHKRVNGGFSHVWGWAPWSQWEFSNELSDVAREIAIEKSLVQPSLSKLELLETAARRMELSWWYRGK